MQTFSRMWWATSNGFLLTFLCWPRLEEEGGIRDDDMVACRGLWTGRGKKEAVGGLEKERAGSWEV